MAEKERPIQPVDATTMPRFAGSSTFVRVPEFGAVPYCDVAVLGVPFDGGVSFRPGARFGPISVRQASREIGRAHV